MRRALIAVLTVALVVQAGPVLADRDYTDFGWDPEDSGGGFLDIRTSQRKVWTSEVDGRRWLIVRFTSNGEYQFIWQVRAGLDSRGGPRADYIMTIAEWDQAPDSRCNVHPRPGRPGKRVEGTFPFSWVVDPTVYGMRCRVRLGAVHATKRIRWKLVSINELTNDPVIVDHAPGGERFYG